MSKPKKALISRVSIGPDVATQQTLIERGGKVGTLAPNTAQYQSNPGFKTTIDEFVTSTQKLDASQTKVSNLEAQLAQARADRDQAQLDAEDAHGAAAKAVEKVSVTPADVQSYGFASLDVVKTGLILPVGILASYNHTTKTIHVHVKYPAGIHGKRCILEISPDPAGPTTYHRVDGDGIRRALTGFMPGTYWLHAATSAAGGRSDWFGPVSVIVT
jgi:outer membrane murein-binding lipoprotein Lpp